MNNSLYLILSSMKILFIWAGPPTTGHIGKKINLFNELRSRILFSPRSPTFPLLANITPNVHEIDIIEALTVKDVDFDRKYDLVGISCLTRFAFTAYNIADGFRRKGTKVVIGGWHASALPKEAKQHADAVVIGEAEETWPQLLNDFEKKSPVNPDIIPVTKKEDTKKAFAIRATRGCPNKCEFCSVTNQKFGNIFRMRNIKDVIEEIKIHKGKYFYFWDDSLTNNPNYAKQLFTEMKGLNKKFGAFGNINILGKDENFLKLASDAGCVAWFIGFESVCQESLNSHGKKTNKVDQYINSVKKIHNHNMVIIGSFVFGFDNDTKSIFNETYDAIQQMELDIPNLLILTPFPGTPLYNRYEKEGRILTKDWSRYTLWDVVYTPKKMTDKELLDGAYEIRGRLCTGSNKIKRIINSIQYGYYPLKISIIGNMVQGKGKKPS